MKLEQFTVETRLPGQPQITVQGYRAGKHFCVHRQLGAKGLQMDDGDWVVTQIASGLQVATFTARDRPLRFARALVDAPGADWSSPTPRPTDPKMDQELSTYVRNLFREISK